MAKGSGSTVERVSALIAEIEAEAYGRGQADARKELLEVLGATEGQAAGVKATRGRRPVKVSPKRRAGGGKRAPRGSVPRFVERVLREHPGSTVPEISGHAAGETERSIKLGSVRVELRNGRMQGRYVSDNGCWSLAVAEASPAAPGETASSDPSPGSEPGAGEGESGPPEEGDDAADSELGGEEGRGTLGLNL